MPSPSPRRTWVNVAILSGVSLGALVVSVIIVLAGDWFPAPSEPTTAPAAGGAPMPLSTPFYMPGVRQPPTQPAAAASVPDDAEVIGVTAGDRHRAYLLSAMSATSNHVVNDLLGGKPVSVTFCDRSQCARVFTEEGGSAPLAIDLGGILQDKLLIKHKGEFYYQETGQTMNDPTQTFPFPDHPFTRTTWKQWKDAHPETDIYVGQSVEGPQQPGTPPLGGP